MESPLNGESDAGMDILASAGPVDVLPAPPTPEQWAQLCASLQGLAVQRLGRRVSNGWQACVQRLGRRGRSRPDTWTRPCDRRLHSLGNSQDCRRRSARRPDPTWRQLLVTQAHAIPTVDLAHVDTVFLSRLCPTAQDRPPRRAPGVFPKPTRGGSSLPLSRIGCSVRMRGRWCRRRRRSGWRTAQAYRLRGMVRTYGCGPAGWS
jgi:hypothetical protein